MYIILSTNFKLKNVYFISIFSDTYTKHKIQFPPLKIYLIGIIYMTSTLD